ncbi:hypothetical protein C1N53_09375 [Pontibacter sp. SGAir0037]|nr:hypothetical protein C1N53_09375 [Pontibacter sp. SGAir0037]
MENLLNQLPPEALDELQGLIAKLVQQYQPEKIICFGCNHHHNRLQSCFTEASSQAQADYYLLVIVASATRREHDMQDFINAYYTGGAVTVLPHPQEMIVRAVQEQNTFFVQVLQDGLLLYAATGFVQAQAFPVIDPKQQLKKAEQAYRCRHERAYGFLFAARKCLSQGYLQLAVFQLHQAVEQSCCMLVNVCMGYRSDIHNIGRLLRLCGCFYPGAAALFPQRTQE